MAKVWEKVEVSPAWDFREENEFEGYFQSVETEVGPNKSTIYYFKKYDGEVVGIWGNTILDSRFKNLKEGDDVKIVYKGKKKNLINSREYNDFEVYRATKEEAEQVKNEDETVIESDKIPF